MLYNEAVTYEEPGFDYIGIVVLKIQGILDPIILNDIKVIFAGKQDYSTATTIAVLSVDVAPTGYITIEALDDSGAALIEAQTITVYSNTVVGIG